MKIEWDVPIAMDDGVVLRADVFRPEGEGRFPAILSDGPYGKGLAFQDGYRTAWEIMARENPDALAGSSNRYQNREVVDPEKWVPDGYVCVRVDSRGAGRSPRRHISRRSASGKAGPIPTARARAMAASSAAFARTGRTCR